jgi:Ni,Fe-hydrogenase III small subunit
VLTPSDRAERTFQGFSAFRIFCLCVFSLIHSPVLAAQTRTMGRVLDADSAPVAGIRVVLHRVAPDRQGPLDSTRSDREGRFRFRFTPDTAAFYLISGRYAGIEYFSAPISTNPHRADTAVTVMVYDTSSRAPVITEARHLVVTRPDQDGARSVLDLVILKNGGRLTRVAPDTLQPSWWVPLPQGTEGLQVGESDISSQAITRRADSLLIAAAIAPGEKQLTLQYQIPAGRTSIALAVQNPGMTVNVLVEEAGARVTGAGLALADSQVIQGRSFRRWTGTLSRATLIRVTVPGLPRTPRRLLLGLVAALALTLAAAGWYGVSRRTSVAPSGAPDDLVSEIAALDARYLGREENTPEQEWREYQLQRARLKAELEASLAAARSSP